MPYLFWGRVPFGSCLFYFLFFLYLFLLFSLLYWWFFMLVQVKQIGWVLQSFLLQQRGKVRFVQEVGGEGIVNCGEINNNTWPMSLQHCSRGWNTGCMMILNDEGECHTEWMKWGGSSQISSNQGEFGSSSRVAILGEPGIRVSLCWNTGCWNERGEVRYLQVGEWVMRWNGTEHLTLNLNK